MRKTLLSSLAVAILLVGADAARAQDVESGGTKPVVTVSFSGYDEILKDVEFIGNAAGNPQMAEMVKGMIQQGVGGQELAGLDTSRPWGFVVQTDGQQFPMYAFVPVTDLKQLLTLAEPVIGKPSDLGDGVLEIEAKNQTIYMVEKGGWAFLAKTPDVLASTPADPLTILEGLNEQYDLAVRISVKNIPEQILQMGLMQLDMVPQMAQMQEAPNETDEQRALRIKMTKQAIEQIKTVVNDLDTFLLGFSIDREASTAYFDYMLTAKDGTKTAEQMAEMKAAPSNFGGFVVPGAALTMNTVSKLAASDVDQVKGAIASIRANSIGELEKQGLSPAELEQASKLVDDLFSVLDATIDGGKVDIGLSLLLDPNALTFVAGGTIGDSGRLETLIKNLAGQIMAEDPGVAEVIKLDADSHEGVRFHSISLPAAAIAGEAQKLPEMVGDTLDVIVGIGEGSLYLAAGRDASDKLKEAITKSKSEAGNAVPPMRFAVAATPIAKFVAAVGKDEAKGVATMVAGMLEQAEGKDRITITSSPVPGGIRVRLELEQGLLAVLGALPMLLAAGG